MRTCPKCKKRELDVTDKPNSYRCWNCGYFCLGTKHLPKKEFVVWELKEDPQ